jgi:hypothetical protein
MTKNPGIEAVRKLAHLGYRFTVNGETIKARHEGPGEPDPAQVRPLLEVMKVYKSEVLNYLVQKPQLPPERILTCSECPWHQTNPWTHYPDLPAWCDWHFDHLAADSPACIGYRRGDVPTKGDE